MYVTKKGEKRGVYSQEAMKRAQSSRKENPMGQEDDDVSLSCDALISGCLIAAVMCEFERDASVRPLLAQLTSLDLVVLTHKCFKHLLTKRSRLRIEANGG
jgi:hypothetical protein